MSRARAPEGLEIVPMCEADLPEVLAIERASFPIPWDETLVRAEMSHELARCRVLKEYGLVVANLFYWTIAGDFELHNVAVAPLHRSRGFGKILVEHLIEQARRAAAERVVLEVRRGNTPAISLYSRLGFLTVGVRERYYRDNLEDALLMELALSPERVAYGEGAGR